MVACAAEERARADGLQAQLSALEDSWGRWQQGLSQSKLIDLGRMETLDLRIPHL